MDKFRKNQHCEPIEWGGSSLALFLLAIVLLPGNLTAQTKPPNILVIFGDDIGIVIYTTDNGNELLFWPDGAYATYRGEKGTTWEGGLRVPCPITYSSDQEEA